MQDQELYQYILDWAGFMHGHMQNHDSHLGSHSAMSIELEGINP
jgi:hypothetical protein